MDDAFIQKGTGWAQPPIHSAPDAELVQWHDPPNMSDPKLPPIEVANIEIAALADLYQQQLAEICAEHSLLLEDQSKLAKLIAPYLDEHGHVTGEFDDTILLLKQGLDLRLLEYEEDCRRIQQTERRLQRRIDDILVNYELLAVEAQGLAESRLQEQVKNMRRMIRVLQSELDETRFQRDVYADETRRLRGICRFGHWIEDGYGVVGTSADYVGAPQQARSHGSAQTSSLSAANIRQPRQSNVPMTCVKASQRAQRTEDNMTRQRAETSSLWRTTDETRDRRRESRTAGSVSSQENEQDENPAETQGRGVTQPSYFQEVLAKLLAGSEEAEALPAQRRSTPVTLKAARQRQGDAPTQGASGIARRSEGVITRPRRIARPRAASMEDTGTEPQRPGGALGVLRRDHSLDDMRRGVSIASRESNSTVEGVARLHRRRTGLGEQTFAGPDMQDLRGAGKPDVARSLTSIASEGVDDAVDDEKAAVTPRKASATTRGPEAVREDREVRDGRNRSAPPENAERERTGVSNSTLHPRETLVRQASATRSVDHTQSEVQRPEPPDVSLSGTGDDASEQRQGPEKEEEEDGDASLPPSPTASSPSEPGRTSWERVQAEADRQSAAASSVDTPVGDRARSVHPRLSRTKEQHDLGKAAPWRSYSRTLASPRPPASPAAPLTSSPASEPVADAYSANRDSLIPAWRRTRTMRSPLSQHSLESAPESPEFVKTPGGGPSFLVQGSSEKKISTHRNPKEGFFNRNGLPPRDTRTAVHRRSGGISAPRPSQPARADSRPRILSAVSRSGSVLLSARRLASPRSSETVTAPGTMAAALGLRGGGRFGDRAENLPSSYGGTAHALMDDDAEER